MLKISPIMSTIAGSNSVIVGVCITPRCNKWKIYISPQGTVLLNPLCSSSIHESIHPSNIHVIHLLAFPPEGVRPLPQWHSHIRQGGFSHSSQYLRAYCLLLGKFPFSRCHSNSLLIPDCSSGGYSPIHTHRHTQTQTHTHTAVFSS